MTLGDHTPRSFGFLFDLQNDTERVMPHVRYLNALDGQLKQKWQFKRERAAFTQINEEENTVSHYHLSPEGWEDIPDGTQRLCYNEIATKHNWHYLRFDFDLATMRFLYLQCNDRVLNVAGLEPIRIEAMQNLWCMLNLALFAETDADRRVFAYFDSVVLSGDF